MKKRTLTDTDIDLIRGAMREEVKEEVSHLPTKDEFYAETAKLYKRQNDLEEEKDVLSHRVSRHSDQIARIEEHLEMSPLE